MVTKAMTTLVNAFMQPFKMFRDKLNTVIVVNLIVLNKTLLVFYTHAVFRNKTVRVAIIITQIRNNIVNARLIDFPATVRIHFTSRHFVIIKQRLWHKRRVRIDGVIAAFHPARLVVVNAQQVDFTLGDELAVAGLAGR